MGFTKLVRYPFGLWVQVFVVYNTIPVWRRHRPFWIWPEPCRLEQMNVNVLPNPSTPAHCLQSQCTAHNQQNRPSAWNIMYDIVISLIVAVPILILIVTRLKNATWRFDAIAGNKYIFAWARIQLKRFEQKKKKGNFGNVKSNGRYQPQILHLLLCF